MHWKRANLRNRPRALILQKGFCIVNLRELKLMSTLNLPFPVRNHEMSAWLNERTSDTSHHMSVLNYGPFSFVKWRIQVKRQVVDRVCHGCKTPKLRYEKNDKHGAEIVASPMFFIAYVDTAVA